MFRRFFSLSRRTKALVLGLVVTVALTASLVPTFATGAIGGGHDHVAHSSQACHEADADHVHHDHRGHEHQDHDHSH